MEQGLANKILSYDYDEALIELINLFFKSENLDDIVIKLFIFFFNFKNIKIIQLFCNLNN